MTSPLAVRGRTAVKFCGITSLRDASLAREAGADAAGVILAPSPRRVSLTTALELAGAGERPPMIVAAVGEDLAAVPQLLAAGFTVQFCAPISARKAGSITGGAAYLRVVHLDPDGDEPFDATFGESETPLFDTVNGDALGGSGRPFAWARIAQVAARRPVVVAGGLRPENVGACIRSIRPAAVDVRSGVERLGRKSNVQMRDFVRAVREADAGVYGA